MTLKKILFHSTMTFLNEENNNLNLKQELVLIRSNKKEVFLSQQQILLLLT
jgi:hypothetical protein